MAEFLIRIRSKTHADPYKDVKLLKRGDVVWVYPDGHTYSQRELTNPDWRIIRVTGISAAEAESYLSREPGDPDTNRMLLRRWFRLNVDKSDLTTAEKNFLTDDTRSRAIGEVSLARLRELKQQKESVPDPNVIG